MEIETIIGFSAAILSTIAFLPQAIKVWKTKSAKDLSVKTFVILVAALSMWLIYGILKNDLPIISANMITLALVGSILYYKIKYG